MIRKLDACGPISAHCDFCNFKFSFVLDAMRTVNESNAIFRKALVASK